MAAPAPDVLVRPNPRAVYRDLADGAGGVVLHLDTAVYHGVNAFGAHVWSSLGEGVTFADLMAGIRTYGRGRARRGRGRGRRLPVRSARARAGPVRGGRTDG